MNTTNIDSIVDSIVDESLEFSKKQYNNGEVCYPYAVGRMTSRFIAVLESLDLTAEQFDALKKHL